jgi:hypothetical protein
MSFCDSGGIYLDSLMYHQNGLLRRQHDEYCSATPSDQSTRKTEPIQRTSLHQQKVNANLFQRSLISGCQYQTSTCHITNDQEPKVHQTRLYCRNSYAKICTAKTPLSLFKNENPQKDRSKPAEVNGQPRK